MNFEKMKQAIAARNEFLDNHPEMKEYQAIIDKELDKAGESIHNRMVVLENMMLEKRQELLREMNSLKFLVETLSQSVKGLK